MKNLPLLACVALLLSVSPLLSAAANRNAPAGRPNIVFVITDDQGYGDLGFTGNPVVKTPHLDRLAAESSQLKDYLRRADLLADPRSFAHRPLDGPHRRVAHSERSLHAAGK